MPNSKIKIVSPTYVKTLTIPLKNGSEVTVKYPINISQREVNFIAEEIKEKLSCNTQTRRILKGYQH